MLLYDTVAYNILFWYDNVPCCVIVVATAGLTVR